MEIFKLFGSIFVDNEKANDSISKTDKKAKGLTGSLGKGIVTAGKWAAGITAGAIAVGGALLATANKAAEATDRIDKMSQSIGFSRKGFQEWDYILSQNGSSVDSLKSGMKALTQGMKEAEKGTGKGADAFKELGISMTDINGNMKSQEQVFEETVIALQGMEDGTRKAQLAQDLFSKSGQELMPLLNGTSESVENLKQKANDLGMVLSDDAIDAGVNFTDAMDTLKRSFGGIFTQLGTELMPLFITLANWITENMPEIREAISTAFNKVSEVTSFLMDNAINPLIDIFKGGDFSIIKTMVQDVFSAVEEYMSIAMDVINDLKDTVIKWVENNKDKLLEIKNKYKETFDKIMDLVDTVLGIIRDLWTQYGDEIMAVVDGMLTTISDLFSGALDIIMDILDIFINLFKGDWEGLWESVKSLIENIWNTITTYLENVINTILGFFGTDLATIKETVLEIFNNIKETISRLIDDYKQKIYDNIQAILGFFGTDLETVISTVTDIFTNIKETISGIIDSVIGIIDNMIGWIERAIDKINIFKREKKNAEVDESREYQVDGSHANGLNYVPFDGYIAELHQGERVLTAKENKEYGKGFETKGFSQTINIYSPKPLTPSETARQIKNTSQKLALDWGVT